MDTLINSIKENTPFNNKPSYIMHIDINSCFATIEQQANPLLRYKPVAVAARDNDKSTIVAPSIEAKKLGIKTGMKVFEAKNIYPKIIILDADPEKYRYVHVKMRKILDEYTGDVHPKSIDEFVLNLENYPAYKRGLVNVAQEIKQRIRSEIGEYISVSIGIGPSRFTAKTAAGLKKPDGLEELNSSNYNEVYAGLQLPDLYGINKGNTVRLNRVGVFDVKGLYEASIPQLKSAFQSVLAYYWFLRIRGYEVDDYESHRKTYSNSYVLPKPLSWPEISSIIQKLVEKTGIRMRDDGYKATGIHVGILYEKGKKERFYWHVGETIPKEIFDSHDIYKEAVRLFKKSPYDFNIRKISVACFGLTQNENLQLDFFENSEKKAKQVKAVDEINQKLGDFKIIPARMLNSEKEAPDTIAFGNVRELNKR